MKTCPYCNSPVELTKERTYGCVTCKVILDGIEWAAPTVAGERPLLRPLQALVDLSYFTGASLVDLDCLHTHDLLHLLRLAREERSKVYQLLRTFNKASDLAAGEEYKEAASAQGVEYEYWTRRVWMVENLLVDRMGYYPQQITDEMLLRIREQVDKTKAKKMAIRRERRNVNKAPNLN